MPAAQDGTCGPAVPILEAWGPCILREWGAACRRPLRLLTQPHVLSLCPSVTLASLTVWPVSPETEPGPHPSIPLSLTLPVV